RVGRGAGVGHVVRDGADGHEVPAAATYQVRDKRASDQKRTGQIHGDRPGEVVRRGVGDRLDEKDPGVVDDDVGDPTLGEDPGRGTRHGGGVCDVTGEIGAPAR